MSVTTGADRVVHRHKWSSAIDSTENPASPSLSVILPTFNRCPEVSRLVRSLLRDQTFHNFVLIVVDDGSTDKTLRTLRSLDDERLVVVEGCHVGVSASRNAGAAIAETDWLVFLDSDDDADADWLEAFVDLMTDESDIVSIGQRRLTGNESVVRLPEDLGRPFGNLKVLWQAGAFAMTRTLFDEVGGFTEGLEFSENTELALRVAARHEQAPVTTMTSSTAHYTVNMRRDRYNARRQFQSSQAIIAIHKDRLGFDAALLADYHAIAGVGARKIGRRRQAIGQLVQALRCQPLNWRHWLRLGRTLLPR